MASLKPLWLSVGSLCDRLRNSDSLYLGLDFDGEGSGCRLAVRLITSTNRSTGTFITPFRRGFKPKPVSLPSTATNGWPFSRNSEFPKRPW